LFIGCCFSVLESDIAFNSFSVGATLKREDVDDGMVMVLIGTELFVCWRICRD
jgi:hypothetical protein